MKLDLAERLPAPPEGYRWQHDVTMGPPTNQNTVLVKVNVRLVPIVPSLAVSAPM